MKYYRPIVKSHYNKYMNGFFQEWSTYEINPHLFAYILKRYLITDKFGNQNINTTLTKEDGFPGIFASLEGRIPVEIYKITIGADGDDLMIRIYYKKKKQYFIKMEK